MENDKEMNMDNQNQNSPEEKKSFLVRNVWLSPVFYVYFISVVLALGMLYVHRENMVNRNSIAPDIQIDSIYNAPIKAAPAPQPAPQKITVDNLLTPTKAQLTRGENLYKMDCAPCHGLEGKGDGPAAASLNPKPRDYHSTAGWVNGRLLSDMFKTVSEGINGSAMVSFAGALSVNDRLAIIDYIRANFGDFPKDTPEQLEALNKKYHLEEVGEKSSAPAAPISVDQSMKQIEEDAIPRAGNVENALSYISAHASDDGATIFYGVTINPRRALTMLSGSTSWSKNESDFVTIVTMNAVQNGFDPKVAQLTTNEWQSLFNYMKNVFAAVGGNGRSI